MGERFTALPSNHPLGHYFDALHLTGYYYTFIGVGQLMAALLLLIPRTALLGAILYFPIILNICVLAYALRFEGTRITTLMLLANLFLLVWDYDRLKYVPPLGRPTKIITSSDKANKFPVWFLGLFSRRSFQSSLSISFWTIYGPGILRLNARMAARPMAVQTPAKIFCDCIYNEGNPLNACLDEYERAKEAGASVPQRRHPR